MSISIMTEALLGASAILLMTATPSRAQHWVDNDLTALAGGGPALPESPLAGDWGPGNNNQQHVNFIDPRGHVHELVFDTGNSSVWVDDDLTRSGTVAGNGSGIDRYWGGDGSQHVNFIDQIGHIHELFIGGGGGDWMNNDLTALAHSATIAADRSGLDGYWGSNNGQHVNFIDQHGHLHELFIHPGAEWVDNDLTTLAINGTAGLRESSLVGDGGANGNNQQHVNFFDANFHVHELFLPPGASRWVDDDLTSSAHGTPSVSVIALHRYWESAGPQHIDYITRDGHIRELVNGVTKWVEQDLTATVFGPNGFVGGTPAGGGSGVTGDEGRGTAQQHVNFFDTNFHVHELFFPTGATGLVGFGKDDDLTASVGGATASPSSTRVIHRYWGSDGSQHVNFIDFSGHVHELYISGPQSGGGGGGGGPCPQAGAAGCACNSGGSCNAGLVCVNGTTCITCGGVSQACCQGNTCSTSLSCKVSPPQTSMTCLP